MSETTILYAGIFCLAFVLVGMVLTIYEFRKLSASESPSKPKLELAYKT